MRFVEFALSDQLMVAARTGVASILGAVLGIERWRSGKEAGMRTHALVAAAAALAVGLGEMVLVASGMGGDATRTMHAVLTGVGFIGAGAILHGSERTSGLTTAASVFNAAAIGACAGSGAIVLAALASVGALVVLRVFGRVRRLLLPDRVDDPVGRDD
jgi:putative Mg2+ transporter-C (MgtC) family protein